MAERVSSAFIRLLDKRLRDVAEAEHESLPSMIPVLFGMESSDSAWEEYSTVGDLPDITEFNGRLTEISQAPGYLTRIEPVEYGNDTRYERKLMDDKKYPVFLDGSRLLMKSAHRTQEKKAVRVLTNAFSTSFDF